MKKLNKYLIFLCFTFLFFIILGIQTCYAEGESWQYLGQPAFSAGRADYTSIAIDATGTPYVVYQDYGNSNKATVMKYDGSSWVNVG
ncbi:MAG TPA: hypothetical protein PKL50_04220, partial [bacterium]|nr:hypothetical protein [bacterium]